MKMGARIKDRMRELNTTPVQLAVDINIPMNTIKGWADGACMPSGDRLSRLAQGLRMKETTLLLGDKNG